MTESLSLISNNHSQCGNLRTSPSLRFYVKSYVGWVDTNSKFKDSLYFGHCILYKALQIKCLLPGIDTKKKYDVPRNRPNEFPKVRAKPTAQYTRAPIHISNQFLIRILTVFLDL